MKRTLTYAAIAWLLVFFAVNVAVVSCKHHKYSKKYDQKPKHR